MKIRQIFGSISPSRDALWYILSVAAAAAGFLLANSPQNPAGFELVRALMLTVGTLFGFLMTSLSILIAIINRPFAEKLKKSGHLQNLTDQIFITSFGLLVGLFAAVAYLLTGWQILGAFVCACALFGMIMLLRVGWKYRILFLNI